MSFVVGARVDAPQADSGAAPVWTPASLTGLAFWYDFGDATTLFSDTAGTTPALDLQGVARANDKSGNGRFLQQAVGGQQPTRDASFSPPVVFFDGGDRLFASTTFGPIAQPYTIAIVSDNNANSSMFWDSGSAGTRQTATRGASSTEVAMFAGASLTRTGVPDLGTRRAWLFVYNGASSQIWCYDPGSGAFVQQGANANAGTNALADMRLGGNTINFLQSLLTSEVVGWGAAASPTDRANLAPYFAAKWSLL